MRLSTFPHNFKCSLKLEDTNNPKIRVAPVSTTLSKFSFGEVSVCPGGYLEVEGHLAGTGLTALASQECTPSDCACTPSQALNALLISAGD